MITYYRHLLKNHPLEGDDPARLRRLEGMSKDTAVQIYELLNRENKDGIEQEEVSDCPQEES